MARRVQPRFHQMTRLSVHALAGLIGAAAIALSGCTAATTVSVQGAPADLSALTGEWRGTYTSPDLDRQGTIWFRLVEGEDHAHGDVRMTPRRRSEPYQPYDELHQRPHEPTQFLSIRVVQVSSNDVQGILEPYWDPDCECVATTTFRGQRDRNRLQGTFETRLMTGTTVTGRWRADRRVTR